MSRSGAQAVVLVLASLVAGGCGPAQEVGATRRALPTVLVVHPFGDAFGAALTATVKSARVEARPHPGGSYITDLLMLERGEADAVFVYADIAYMASVGQLEGMRAPLADARAIAQLPGSTVQVLVSPGSHIQSLSDLRHRRVAIGPSHSETIMASRFVLDAFGIALSDIDARELPFTDASRLVMRGDLDAAFWNAAVGIPNIAAAIEHGARLLDISGPPVARLRAEYPFLKLAVVPGGTYPGLEHSVHSVGMDMTFVCRSGVDEDVAHDLARAFMEIAVNETEMTRGRPGMNPSRAASTVLPLHPGAARYYREHELLR